MNHFHSLELPLETRFTSTISCCLKITQNVAFEFFVPFLAFLMNFCQHKMLLPSLAMLKETFSVIFKQHEFILISKIQMDFVCKCCSMKSFLGHIFFFSSLDFS